MSSSRVTDAEALAAAPDLKATPFSPRYADRVDEWMDVYGYGAPVAVSDPEAGEGVRELIYPRVPLRVGERAPVLIDQRGPIGPAPGGLGQDLSN